MVGYKHPLRNNAHTYSIILVSIYSIIYSYYSSYADAFSRFYSEFSSNSWHS